MPKSTRRRTPLERSTPRKRSTLRNSRTTVSGPAAPDASGRGDVLAEKAAGTQEVASAIPFNPIKGAEYDPTSALAPHEGPSVKPADPIVGASTVTESNDSEKAGSGGPIIGHNPTVGPLDRPCVWTPRSRAADDECRGCPLPTIKAPSKRGCAGPPCSKTSSSAKRSPISTTNASPSESFMRAARRRTATSSAQGASGVHAGVAVRGGRQADAGLRPLLDGARRARIDRHG